MSFTFILIQAGTACCQTFSVPQALRRNGWRAAVPFWGRGKARRTGPFQRKRRFPGGQGRNAMAGQGGNTGERGMPRRKSRVERARGARKMLCLLRAFRRAGERSPRPCGKVQGARLSVAESGGRCVRYGGGAAFFFVQKEGGRVWAAGKRQKSPPSDGAPRVMGGRAEKSPAERGFFFGKRALPGRFPESG